jgi:hypothetical protein
MYPAPCGYPAGAVRRKDGLEISVMQIGAVEFSDAFTAWTVERVGGSKHKHFLPTPVFPRSVEGAPTGIIFHVGRCGSTLVSQLLKHVPSLTVYSEPDVIDDVLRPPREWSDQHTIGAFRLLGHLFAEHSGGKYIWKLRSASTLFCDVVVRAFPNTPWVFCVRDPLEVGVSFLSHAVPVNWLKQYDDCANPYLPFMPGAQDGHPSREIYFARAFAYFCRAIGRLDRSRGLVVRYEDLPDAAWSTVAPHFGVRLTAEETSGMARAATLYSKVRKGKTVSFAPDSPDKQQAAHSELRSAVDVYARSALAELLR